MIFFAILDLKLCSDQDTDFLNDLPLIASKFIKNYKSSKKTSIKSMDNENTFSSFSMYLRYKYFIKMNC